MKKTELYTVIILSFCSTILDFMLTENYTAVFPRDRVIHIGISLAVAFVAMHILSFFDFQNLAAIAIASVIMALRMIYVCIEYIRYFHTFHGSNSIGIILFSVLTVLLLWKYMYDKMYMLYSFFISFNIAMLVLVIFLSAEKINVSNIYYNSLIFDFNINKLPLLFDIVTVSLLTDKRSERVYAGKRYLLFSAGYMLFITILQGLCINGTMLYSVSPLQSLMQIASTVTIPRFDYIFTIYHTLNYLGAIILYSWVLKKLTKRKMETVDEKA